MSGTVIDELVTILGVDVNSSTFQTIKRMSEGLTDIAKTAAKVGAAVTAAASAALYLAERLNQTTAGIGNFSQLTGISTKNVQALGVAVEQIGGNFQSVQSDLMNLSKTMDSPIPGQFNQNLFMLGVNLDGVGKSAASADEIFLRIADRFQGMSNREQLQWGGMLGFSNDTIRLLQMGRGEIERLKKEAENLPTIVNPQSIKNAQLFVQEFSLLRRILLYIGQEAASFAGPALQGIVRDVGEWLKANRALIESGLETFIQGTVQGFRDFWNTLTTLKDKFNELFPGVSQFIEHMMNSKLVAALVEGALAAIAVGIGVLVASYAPLIATITAAGLVFNDLIAYLKGGNSMIGEMIKWVGELYKEFAEKFPNIAGFVEMLGRVFKDLGSIIWNTVVVGLETVFDWLKKVGTEIGGFIGKLMSMIDRFLAKVGFGKRGQAAKDLSDIVGAEADRMRGYRSNYESEHGWGNVGAKSVSASKNELMKQGMDYFMSQGFTREQAAGIMGNLMQESGLDTGAIGDSGQARGIAQWHPDRWRKLIQFAKENGLNPNDYHTQLAFIMHEFQTTEKNAYAAVKASGSTAAATEAFSSKYERAGTPMMANRIGYANSALNTAYMPGAGGGNTTSNRTEVNITQHIQGSESEQIAQQSAKKIDYSLQQLYPGTSAPVTG